jgi:hypothetical protein
MSERTRADLAARAFLTLGALLPYWRLLTFGVIYVTDDYFASDIYNGELPGRVLVGQLIRQGQWPVWTNQLCSGLPLAGLPADPLGLAAFSMLAPGPALDLYVITLLLVAAHGSYGLARRFGSDRTAAVLAGIAFAGSGYLACQLKHLAIVSTVVWLPVGLSLLDRTFVGPHAEVEAPSAARRALFMGLFGLVFAEQALSGFPQSAYICALVYGVFVLFRAVTSRREFGSWRASLKLVGGVGAATMLGAAAGAVVLLPLSALGSVSDRAESLGWEWSSRLAYWPPNVLTFFRPYVHGDISDNTYAGWSLFWEDYGYVGLATVLLACYGGWRARRQPLAAFAIGMTLAAYLLVLGPATPAFRVAYELVPGMKLFRLPTRFLIVVELGLALLAAIGLTRLREALARRWPEPSRFPAIVALALCAGTAVDLWIHQPRQNPMVPATSWLAAPASVHVIHADTQQPRTFTPRHRELHRRAFRLAHGWADTTPYYELRDVLEPNTGGGFWNTPSADCYAGIAARWHIDVWGDHSREQSLVSSLASVAFQSGVLRIHPALPKVLRTYGVSHVLSPYPQEETELPLVSQDGHAYIYRIEGSARVRFVPSARSVTGDREAASRLLAAGFDPAREILLHDAPGGLAGTLPQGATPPEAMGRAAIMRENTRSLDIEVEAPQDGFLLLADTFYPGWTARVDGVSTPLYRANIAIRGIALPKGRHDVRFEYGAPEFFRGLTVTLIATAALLVWVAGAFYTDRRLSGRVSAATR